ncbi:MAG: cytochrome c [Deltaproteobacteria bacterium]|nr:cytochrome c [Deltaproteobacteria bacterium]
MLKRLRFFLPAIGFLMFLPNAVFAELELRGVMKELGGLTEGIVTAINKGDFDAIYKNALAVNNYRRPSTTEMTKILDFLKADAKGFNDADTAALTALQNLAEAAEGKDIDRVIEQFSSLLKGCVGCHTKYRDRIVGQFYK